MILSRQFQSSGFDRISNPLVLGLAVKVLVPGALLKSVQNRGRISDKHLQTTNIQ